MTREETGKMETEGEKKGDQEKRKKRVRQRSKINYHIKRREGRKEKDV